MASRINIAMKPKLNKWYNFTSRFKVVPADIREDEYPDSEQFKLIIEFPDEYRKGWFPFELQLRGPTQKHWPQGSWSTNYWCNPFGVQSINQILNAIDTLRFAQNHITVHTAEQNLKDYRENLRRMIRVECEKHGMIEAYHVFDVKIDKGIKALAQDKKKEHNKKCNAKVIILEPYPPIRKKK